MLFDHQSVSEVEFAAWRLPDELNAEAAERDAARDIAEYLGFSRDGDVVPSVSVRLKALYKPQQTLSHEEIGRRP
jgi:hypothetical protein